MHTTSRYPDWWRGRRFERPVNAWACGVTSEVVRDTVQRVLVGRPGQEGTGSTSRMMLTSSACPRGVAGLFNNQVVQGRRDKATPVLNGDAGGDAPPGAA
jgi:hypothetical protein